MDSEFVEDWEKTKARFAAWWHNEIVDRPPVLLTCPRPEPRWALRPIPDRQGIDPRRLYLDSDYRIDAIENELSRTDYFGDAIPQVSRGINTVYLGQFAGAVPKFAADTVWCEPFVTDWGTTPRPKFDTELPVFQQILAVSDALIDNARGRYVPAFPDHLDVITAMSQMRGVEAFILDLVDAPEAACAYRDALTEVWKQSFDYWVERDGRAGLDGINNWATAYSPTRGGVLQCDFCAMISPEMFKWLVVPELAAEAQHLDGAMYHLDGPDALSHVDLICDIPGITVIQWVPGAGNPAPVEWPDLLRKLQDAGKALQFRCSVEELDRVCEMLRPEGVMLRMQGQPDADACRHALKRIEKWAAQGAG